MFSENIPRACLHCQYSSPTDVEEHLLCPKKGIVTPSYKCRKYKYDPTKRIPPQKLNLPQFSPEDFKLD